MSRHSREIGRNGTWVLVSAAMLLVPRAASPQGDPQGPEFRVNTYTTGAQGGSGFGYQCPCQNGSSIAADANGNFVVVWHSENQDGSGFGVFGQRYGTTGTPLGSEFRVNADTTGSQMYPAVAAGSSGNFVVVWRGDDGSGSGISGQRFSSSGIPLGPEFRANSYTTGFQTFPSVATDLAGNFVVVWGQFAGTDSIVGQRYASDGTPLGAEFRVNTSATGGARYPSVAADASGNFVVAWQSFALDGSQLGVFAQRYAGSGNPLGPEFRVNTYTTGHQHYPSVAADASGAFVVVWNGPGLDDPQRGIFGQRYASSGAPLGTEYRINSYTTGSQWRPRVSADSMGNFVVVWTGAPGGVLGQRYLSSGSPLGSEFRINSYTPNSQDHAAVAADSGAAGRFTVIWEDAEQDGSWWGIFGQRYNQVIPVELTGFTVE